MAFAAPEAGAGAASLLYMALALVAFLGYIVARGLIATWTHSLGFLLNWLGNELSFKIPTGFSHITVDLGGPFLEVDRLVLTALQTWAAGLEAETAYFWHGSATLLQWTVDQVSGLADDTADAFEWMIHSHLPKWAKYAVAPGALVPLIAKLVIGELRSHLPTITKTITTYVHEVPSIVNRVTHAAGAIPLPNPWAIPHFHRWYLDLTKWRRVTQERLARLEKLLGAAGLAIAMANVLGLPNWRCLTRGNVGKTARHLCGLSGSALTDLLGLIADALILTDICTIITLLEKGLALVQPALTDFITGASALACYGANVQPPAMPALELDLPPAIASLALDIG